MWVLYLGMAAFNIGFLIYCIIVLDRIGKGTEESKLIEMAFFCWLVSLFSTGLLVVSVSYTICKLREMFPNQQSREVKRIMIIGVCFCVSFIFKTVYNIVIFYDQDKAVQLVRAGESFLVIFFDLIPVSSIYYMHHLNYSHHSEV